MLNRFSKPVRPRPRVEGVSYAHKPRVVKLQRRVVRIEVDRNSFNFFRKSALVLLLLLISVGGIIASFARKTVADTTLSPQTCLGGWNNPAHAEGSPQLDGSDFSLYDTTNSASISNALSQLYCGQFSGDIPSDTQPTQVTLKISWAIRKTQPVSITTDSFASSTPDILNAPSGDAGTLTVTASTTSADTEASSSAPTNSASQPSSNQVSASSTQASSPPQASTAAAPDTSAPASSTPPSTPDTSAPTPIAPVVAPADPSSSSTPQSLLHDAAQLLGYLFAPNAYAQSDASSSLVVTPESTSSAASSSAPTVPDGTVEVLYTTDGTTWNSIAIVPASSFSTNSFVLPSDTIKTWDDISKLQIEVRTLSSADPSTTIYVDGMQIDVAYAATPQKTPKDTDKQAAMTSLEDGAAIADSDLSNAEVHPQWNDKSTNVIFYQDYGNGNTTYVAESEGHGDAPLSSYYTPLPDPGKYIMIEYQNDGGSFECNGISAEQCAADPHFVARTNFEVVADASSTASAGSATTSGATIDAQPATSTP